MRETPRAKIVLGVGLDSPTVSKDRTVLAAIDAERLVVGGPVSLVRGAHPNANEYVRLHVSISRHRRRMGAFCAGDHGVTRPPSTTGWRYHVLAVKLV